MEDSLEKAFSKRVEHIFLYEEFDRMCPFYMSVGMTYNEFWQGDVSLTRFYLEAYRIKEKREAEKLKWEHWEQGLYVYVAVEKLVPVLRAFSSVKKPLPYPELPLGMEEDKDIVKEKEKQKKKLEAKRMELFLKNWVSSMQDKFKEEDNNGNK